MSIKKSRLVLYGACEQLFRQYFEALNLNNTLFGYVNGVKVAVEEEGADAFLIRLGDKPEDIAFAVARRTSTDFELHDTTWKRKDFKKILKQLIPLPAKNRIYAWRHGRNTIATVGVFGGDIVVRPLPHIVSGALSLPATMEPRQFWQLFAAGSITRTIENHLSTGWLWRMDDDARRSYPRPVQMPANVIRTASPREPLNLPMIDDGSCGNLLVSNLRWMYGLSNAQSVDEVDARTGREPEGSCNGFAMRLVLLQDGFEVVDFDDFDDSRLLDLSYHASHYARIWAGRSEYVTPDVLRMFAAMEEQYEPLFRPYSRQYQRIYKRLHWQMFVSCFSRVIRYC